jgi:hypothetical protein
VVATANWSGLGSSASAQGAAVLDIIVNRVLPAVRFSGRELSSEMGG